MTVNGKEQIMEWRYQGIYLIQHTFNNWYVNLDFDKLAAATVVVGSVLFVVIILLNFLWNREL